MSNSSMVNYVSLSPNKTSPRNHKIDTITIHCVVGQLSVETLGNIFASKARNASCNYGIGSDGRVGMYVEEKDRSWCSSNKSNDHRAITIECASDTTHPYAINDKVYKTLVKLCADICKRNNIKELKWKADKSLIGQVDKQNMTVHRWFANKTCPGDYIYNRLGTIASEVNSLLGTGINNTTPVTYTLKDFVKDVQSSFGAKVDGIAGPETLSKTLTISTTRNSRHTVVKYIQKRLSVLGYTEVGTADGIAGTKFKMAVIHFQKDHGCTADGEITAEKKTWKKLLGMD